jgi:hypothetical protein
MPLWMIRTIEEMYYLDDFGLEQIQAELSHLYSVDASVETIGYIVNNPFDEMEELCA